MNGTGNGSILLNRELARSQSGKLASEFFHAFPGLNLGPGCRIFQLNPPCKLALAWPPETGPRRTFIVRLKFHFVSPQCRRDVHTNTFNAPTCVGHTYEWLRTCGERARISVTWTRVRARTQMYTRACEVVGKGGCNECKRRERTDHTYRLRLRAFRWTYTSQGRPLSYALVIEGTRRKLSWRR